MTREPLPNEILDDILAEIAHDAPLLAVELFGSRPKFSGYHDLRGQEYRAFVREGWMSGLMLPDRQVPPDQFRAELLKAHGPEKFADLIYEIFPEADRAALLPAARDLKEQTG